MIECRDWRRMKGEMAGITIRHSGAVQGKVGQIVKLTGEVTIAQAAPLRDALLGALAEADDLQLDLSELSAVDLSGLQLLCAAHRSARTRGKNLQVIDGGNGIFREAARAAGFAVHLGCAQESWGCCLWSTPEMAGSVTVADSTAPKG